MRLSKQNIRELKINIQKCYFDLGQFWYSGNQTKPNPISSQTKSNQIKPDQTKPNQIKSNPKTKNNKNKKQITKQITCLQIMIRSDVGIFQFQFQLPTLPYQPYQPYH